jgi:hypothetical protein
MGEFLNDFFMTVLLVIYVGGAYLLFGEDNEK